MASEYRGLTIKFRGDTTGLGKALSQITKESREAGRNLKSVQTALKLDPSSPKLLAEQVKAVASQCGTAEEKVATLSTAMRQMEEAGEQNTDAYARLSRELSVAEAYLKNGREALVKASQASTELGRAKAQVESWAESCGRSAEALERVGSAASSVGKGLTAALAAMGAGAGVLVTTATDIDTAWRGVVKTVDGTAEELEGLKQSAIDMSTVQPVSAETILNIMELGGQLGVATGNLEMFAQVASGLDIATNLSADEASTQLAQFANITGMTADEYERFASAVVELGNNSATTEADIMQMSLRLASAGSAAGMSGADILGMSAALSSMGVRAEAGGSALSKAIGLATKAVQFGSMSLSEYAEATHQTEAAASKSWAQQVRHLEAFAEASGMTVEEFKRAWSEDATGTFATFVEGLGDAGDELAVTLDNMGLGEIRTSNAMRSLALASADTSGEIKSLSDYVEMANGAWEQNTALAEEVGKRNESLEARFDVLKNKVVAAGEALGGPLAEALLAVLEGAAPLLDKVRESADELSGPMVSAIEGAARVGEGLVSVVTSLVDWFMALPAPVRDLTGQIAGMTAALGPIVLVGGKAVSLLGSFAKVGQAAWSTVAAGIGKVNQFRDALTQADGEILRGYASSKNLTEVMAATANSAVVAAGGIDEYREKSERLAQAQRAVSAAQDRVNEGEREVAAAVAANSRAMEQARDAASDRAAAQRELSEAQSAYDEAVRGSARAAQEAASAKAKASEADVAAFKAASQQRVDMAEAQAIKDREFTAEYKAETVKRTEAARTEAREAKAAYDSKADAAKAAAAKEKQALAALEAAKKKDAAATAKSAAASKRAKSTSDGLANTVKRQAGAQEQLADATEEAADATRDMGDAATGLQKAAAVGKTGLTGLKGALSNLVKTFGPMLAMSAVVAVIEALAYAAEQAKEKAERLSKATDGLRDATEAATSIGELSDAVSGLGEASEASKEDVDSLLEANGKLAESMMENAEEARAQVSELDEARRVLGECAGKASLTAEEQGNLSWALDIVNEKLGLSIDKVNVLSGKYIDANGSVRDLKSSIDELVRAQIREIELESVRENLKSAMEAQKNAYEVRTQALEAYNKAYEDFINLAEDDPAFVGKKTILDRAKEDLDEANAACDEADASFKQLTDRMYNLEAASTGAATAYQTWAADVVSSNPGLVAAFEANGSSVEDFARDLQAAGVDMDDFAAFSEEHSDVLDELARSYRGNFEDVRGTLEEYGVAMHGSAEAAELASNEWAQSFDDATQSALLAASMISGKSLAEMQSVVQGFGVAGETAIQAYALALRSGMAPEAAAELAVAVQKALDDGEGFGDAGVKAAMAYAQALLDGASSEEAEQVRQAYLAPFQEGAEEYGEAGDSSAAAYVDGFEARLSEVDTIAGNVRDQATSSLDASEGAAAKGSESGAAYGAGIKSQEGFVGSGASSLRESMTAALEYGVAEAERRGGEAGRGFGGEMGSQSVAAKGGGNALRQAALGPLALVPAQAEREGKSSGSKFASGISSGSGQVSAAAATLRDKSSGMGSGDSRTWGLHLGQNFASGISSAVGSVAAAARSVAQAAASSMKFSVPESGPWSGSEMGGYTSGRHLVENFAAGMADAVPELRRASETVMEAVEPPTMRAQWEVGRSTAARSKERERDRGAMASEVAKAVSEAIAAQSVVVEVDGRQLANSIARPMNQRLGTMQRRGM